MKIAIQFSAICFLLSFVGCSPKFPLHKATGDPTDIKLKNGRAIQAIILDGDQHQLCLAHKGSLYQIASDSIDYINVNGYNDLEQIFYLGFGVAAIAFGAVSLSDISIGFTMLAVGVLSLVASKASVRKYRFKPALLEDITRLRLHFQYPQGLTLDQKMRILEKYQQLDFLAFEDLHRKS